MSKQSYFVIFILVLAGMLAGACTPAAETEAPAAAPPATEAPADAATEPPAEPMQEMVVSVEGLAPRMDGFFVTAQSWIFTNIIFDALFQVDAEGNIAPGLAESWEMTSPTTWVLNLRPGVKFHNGEDFTAEDVKYTLDFWLDPDNGYANLNRVENVVDVEIIDDLTVQLTTAEPFPLLPGRYSTMYIWPSETHQAVGAEAFQLEPVGTGPFKVSEFALDDFLALEANVDYWGGKPSIDALRFILQPEAATRVAALQAGEIDIAQHVPADLKDLLEGEGFDVLAVPIGQSFIIHFNLLGNTIEPFGDKRVRQAINYAIDIDTIVSELTGGFARKLDGQMAGPDAFGYCPDVEAYPYDPDKARELLDEAGFGDGFSVDYQFGHPRYFRGKEVSETVAAYLSDIGIDVDIEVMEFGNWVDVYFEGTAGPITHVGGNYLPGMDFADIAALMRGGIPESFWDNPEYDALFDSYVSTVDTDERLRIACEMSALLKEEAPIVSLFQIPAIFGISPNVDGVEFGGTGLINFNNASLQE